MSKPIHNANVVVALQRKAFGDKARNSTSDGCLSQGQSAPRCDIECPGCLTVFFLLLFFFDWHQPQISLVAALKRSRYIYDMRHPRYYSQRFVVCRGNRYHNSSARFVTSTEVATCKTTKRHFFLAPSLKQSVSLFIGYFVLNFNDKLTSVCRIT